MLIYTVKHQILAKSNEVEPKIFHAYFIIYPFDYYLLSMVIFSLFPSFIPT